MKYQREYQSEVLEKDYPEINLRPKPNYFLIFIIFAVVVGVAVWYATTVPNKDPQLAPYRQTKRDSAISRVKKRTHKKEECEQYALFVTHNGWYPVLHRGITTANDSIWLNIGEVWKYGKTCNGELLRYTQQVYYKDNKQVLSREDLQYFSEFYGSESDCLIKEKQKIYNYPLLPECVIRTRRLIRPPGNKIDN